MQTLQPACMGYFYRSKSAGLKSCLDDSRYHVEVVRLQQHGLGQQQAVPLVAAERLGHRGQLPLLQHTSFGLAILINLANLLRQTNALSMRAACNTFNVCLYFT